MTLPITKRLVLLCGEDATILKYRAMVVSRGGFEVETAASAQEAVQTLNGARGRYGLLIICHTSAPEDRIELLEAAKARRVPVLQIDNILHPAALLQEIQRILERSSVN